MPYFHEATCPAIAAGGQAVTVYDENGEPVEYPTQAEEPAKPEPIKFREFL